MSQTRRYPAARVDLPRLTAALEDWLAGQNFNCQVLTTDDGGTLLQVEKQGGWRKFTGMSTALNVVLRQSERDLAVEIGAGKWIDKAAAGAVSLFVLWPLAVTAAFGAWEQSKMPSRVFDFIGRYVDREGARPAAITPPAAAAPAPPAAAARADDGALYYLAIRGQTTGPLSGGQIAAGLRGGDIPANALVCPVGGQAWQPVTACPAIAALLPPPPPPPPPMPPLPEEE
jgi:hypothetical protein